MKNSKKRETATVAQANAFKEKLELVKTKSLFVEEVMESLEVERDRSDFILNSFKRALLTFPTNVKADNPEELREWPGLSSLKDANQPMSQEKMEERWQSIEQAINRDSLDEYVSIDFEKGSFVWNGSSLSFLDATIEIRPISIDPLKAATESFDIRANNHLRGMVYLWDGEYDEDFPIQGLLKAVDENGKNWFFELEHFSMMNLTLTRGANTPNQTSNDSNTGTAAGDKTENGEVSATKEWVETINPGMFFLLNKSWQALFVTRF